MLVIHIDNFCIIRTYRIFIYFYFRLLDKINSPLNIMLHQQRN